MAAETAANFPLVFFQQLTDASTAPLQAVTNLSHSTGQLAVPSGSSGVRPFAMTLMAAASGVPPQQRETSETWRWLVLAETYHVRLSGPLMGAMLMTSAATEALLKVVYRSVLERNVERAIRRRGTTRHVTAPMHEFD